MAHIYIPGTEEAETGGTRGLSPSVLYRPCLKITKVERVMSRLWLELLQGPKRCLLGHVKALDSAALQLWLPAQDQGSRRSNMEGGAPKPPPLAGED